MKKIFSIFLLSLSIINIYSINEQILSNKDLIKKAIKKSRPDLLKQNLSNYKATKQDKGEFLDFASKITKIREIRMNLGLTDLIKPDYNPKATDAMLKALGICGGALGSLSIMLYFCSGEEEFINAGAPVLLVSTFLIWLSYIGKKRTQKWRPRKQKYIDSLEITYALNAL